MKNQFSIYWTLIKMQMKSQIEYRGAFNLLFVAKIIGFGYGYIVLYIMLSKFKVIAGWNLYELFFLQSLNMTAYAISSAFFHNPCSQLSKQIQTGEFDVILVKPVNNLLYYMFRVFSTGYIGNITISLSILIYSLYKLQIVFNSIKMLFLFIIIISGSLIQGSLYIISVIPNFWFIKSQSLSDLIFYDSSLFIQYPLSIYPRFIQTLLIFVIPYAFVSFFPAKYILVKSDLLMFHPVFQFLTPPVSVILFIIAYLFWKIGINHYQSTGS